MIKKWLNMIMVLQIYINLGFSSSKIILLYLVFEIFKILFLNPLFDFVNYFNNARVVSILISIYFFALISISVYHARIKRMLKYVFHFKNISKFEFFPL